MNKNINVREQGTQLKCEKCGNASFVNTYFIFKVSKFLTGDSADSMVPVPTFACSRCGNINREFRIDPDESEVIEDASQIEIPFNDE